MRRDVVQKAIDNARPDRAFLGAAGAALVDAALDRVERDLGFASYGDVSVQRSATRTNDPATSHAAGAKAALKSGGVRWRILRFLYQEQRATIRVISFTDEGIHAALSLAQQVSPSGVRTRRHELCEAGYVRAHGQLGGKTLWALTTAGIAKGQELFDAT